MPRTVYKNIQVKPDTLDRLRSIGSELAAEYGVKMSDASTIDALMFKYQEQKYLEQEKADKLK